MLIARPVPRPVAVLLAVVAVVGALSVDRHDPILLLNVSLVGLAALTLTLILYRLDIRHATPLSASEPLEPVEPIPPWRALVPGVSWQTDDRLLLQDIQAHDEFALGTPLRPLKGRHLLSWLQEHDASACQHLSRLMSSRAPIRQQRVRFGGHPGVAMELCALPMRDASGRFLGYAGVLQPLRPEVSEEPVRHHEPSPALACAMSHDLRAPLRAIEGFSTLIKQQHSQGLESAAQEHLDRVISSARRMNQMIDGMLAMAKLQDRPIVSQPVDLSRMAVEVLQELQHQDPARQVYFQVQPDLHTTGDPVLLRQMLDNLLGNAWKYTRKARQARIEFYAEAIADGSLVFVVRDNGAGFDMLAADRLFGLFQRLHSSTEFSGNGVGLASVKCIVNRHGGRVWAEAQPGLGATFRFTLDG